MSVPRLVVSTSPHRLGCTTIRSMHVEWMMALTPALLCGIYYFGGPAITVVAISVISAVVAEALALKVAGKPLDELGNLHAVLLGLLMGLVLPAGAPWWLPMIGSALAVILGKTLFGGMGGYPFNPVVVAWAALALSWPEQMAAFHGPQPLFGEVGDWEIYETPLMELKNDIATLEMYTDFGALWWGAHTGAIGATGTWPLIIGGGYLIIRRLIPWQIPLGVLAGAVVMALVATYTDPRILELGYEEFSQNWNVVLFHLGTGGLMIAAFFLAPEPVTSPVTPWGMFLFGLGVGAMAIIVRTWGTPIDGAFYGVLLMNAATPLFDRIRPKVLGKVMPG